MSGWFIKNPFVLVTYGTSLTTGRLSTRWPERLREVLQAVPEAVGPVVLYNLGRGSQTSDWGVANAYTIADIKPTHVLSEGFAINDCALSGGVPAVSQANHMANMQTMHDTIKAANAATDITWQTMNGVSVAGEGLRPDLGAYYADELTKGAGMGDRTLDNYGGVGTSPPGPVGGWVKPLPDALTDNNDGLHPIQAATDQYLFPNVLFWARKRMAEHWGLPAPLPGS